MAITITNLETVLNTKIAAATTATPGNDLLLISKSVEALDNAIGLKAADIGVNVQAYDATIMVDGDIGTTVQAYDADLTTLATNGIGTSASQIVQLDGTAKLPAVDGSQLVNLPASGTTLLFDKALFGGL